MAWTFRPTEKTRVEMATGSDAFEGRANVELAAACEANEWRSGLYVNATLSLGLCNLRAELSTIVGWAFQAGAGLVLPRIVLRGTDGNPFTAGGASPSAPFDDFFDLEHFRHRVQRWCPQMQIRDTYDTTGVVTEIVDSPRGIGSFQFPPSEYRRRFDDLLSQAGSLVDNLAPHQSIVVRETIIPIVAFKYSDVPFPLTAARDGLVKWAPSLVDAGTELAFHPFLANGFIGIHLRVERDVDHFTDGKWFPSFDEQLALFQREVASRREPVIYLALGDTEHVDYLRRFRETFPPPSHLPQMEPPRRETRLRPTDSQPQLRPTRRR